MARAAASRAPVGAVQAAQGVGLAPVFAGHRAHDHAPSPGAGRRIDARREPAQKVGSPLKWHRPSAGAVQRCPHQLRRDLVRDGEWRGCAPIGEPTREQPQPVVPEPLRPADEAGRKRMRREAGVARRRGHRLVPRTPVRLPSSGSASVDRASATSPPAGSKTLTTPSSVRPGELDVERRRLAQGHLDRARGSELARTGRRSIRHSPSRADR